MPMTPNEVVKDEISKLLDRYMCGKCKINIEGNAKTDCRCIPYEQLIIALMERKDKMNKDWKMIEDAIMVLRQRIVWNNQSLSQTSDPDGFMRNENEAYSLAISLIQDYQKLRERVSVEKIAEIISTNEYNLLGTKTTRGECHNKSAQAIVTYLQQPTEPIAR
jgi:predicted HTH domain antitoxin